MNFKTLAAVCRAALWQLSRDARIVDLEDRLAYEKSYVTMIERHEEQARDLAVRLMASADKVLCAAGVESGSDSAKALESVAPMINAWRCAEDGLWAVHVAGPDELFPVESRDAALEQAAVLNWTFREFDGQGERPSAKAVRWTMGKQAHAEGLVNLLLDDSEYDSVGDTEPAQQPAAA